MIMFLRLIKNNILAFTLIILWLISFLLCKPLIIIFFPGILILSKLKNKPRYFAEQIFYSLGLSIAFWIVIFSFLKFIPVSLTGIFYFIILACLVLLVRDLFIKKNRISFPFSEKEFVKDVIVFDFFLILTIAFLLIFFQQTVPAGADMATHSYTARIIYEKNGFPLTHEPLVPIKSFGFAPYGMSVLIALVSLLSSLPIYRSALLITSLIYPFFGIMLYLFLRNFFSRSTAIFTVFFILFIGKDITRYLSWGGNSTVLSVALVTLGVGCFISYAKKGDGDSKVAFLSALCLVASFYTHPTPLAVLVYFLLLLSFFLITQKHWAILKSLIITGLFCLVLLSSFIASMESVALMSKNHILETIPRLYSQISSNDFLFSKPNPIYFMLNWLGGALFLFVFLGMILALNKNNSTCRLFFLAQFLSILLIFNSSFMLLPLSFLLYPDRILTVSVLPIAFFTALSLNRFKKIFHFSLGNFFRNKIKPSFFTAFSYVFLGLAFYFYISWGLKIIYRHIFIYNSKNFVSVTENDLKVLKWLEKNTDIYDVIDNNYGDAGVWIPAIIGRTIMNNDTNGHYIDELEEGKKKLKPSYLFIGERIVYPESMSFDSSSIDLDKYQLVYQVGEAKIYKVINFDE